MANFEAVVACNGIKMKRGCDNYLAQFQFLGEDVNVAIESDGCIHFYGYSWFSIYRAGEEPSENSECDDQFFEGLRKFVPKNQKLIIHRIGHEKCRFPLSAQAIIITERRVKYEGITC